MTEIAENTATPQGDSNPQEGTHQDGRHVLLDLSRKVMLASIGAVSLAQEEAEAFIQKLIERGELAEKDGNTLLNDLREKRKTRMADAEVELEKRVNRLLEKMSIPTKSDFEMVSERIAALTKKVDELINAKT